MKRRVEPFEVISIIGNVKNAGKTTVLNTLIELFKHQTIGITSIGMDGEKIDTVTSLPKPRIKVYPGFLVATTSECLETCEAKYKLVAKTRVSTALGPVELVRIEQPGYCLVAGPSTIQEMEAIVKLLQHHGAAKIFIDGAFSRHSTSTIADATILCVGANKSRYMDEVIKDARWIVHKLELPAVDEKFQFLAGYNFPVLISFSGELTVLNEPSTITHPEEIIQKIENKHEYLYIPHALGSVFFNKFIRETDRISTKIIISSPISVQLEDELLKYMELLYDRIFVLHPIRLICLCANPYSPKGYEFDSTEFVEKLRENIKLPIMDVLKEKSE